MAIYQNGGGRFFRLDVKMAQRFSFGFPIKTTNNGVPSNKHTPKWVQKGEERFNRVKGWTKIVLESMNSSAMVF